MSGRTRRLTISESVRAARARYERDKQDQRRYL